MIRTKEEIAERSRFIRAATPDCLEELFEMQNRICDLCGHSIQDICLAALDHSISIKTFAEGFLHVEEAVIEANSMKNLRAAHKSCNSSKQEKSRSDWYSQGLNERENQKTLTKEQLEKIKVRSVLGPSISGRKNAGSGQLASIRTRENQSKGGLTCVKNGHLDRIRTFEGSSKGGRTQGRKNMESGQISAIGKIQGKRNAESGHMIRIQKIGCVAGGLIQGPIAGCIAKETGQLASVSELGNHVQWHVNRGLIKKGCKFCEKS